MRQLYVWLSSHLAPLRRLQPPSQLRYLLNPWPLEVFDLYFYARNARLFFIVVPGPIKDFRAERAKATEAVNRTGLLVHDLCRSAARNLSRAGIHETVASKFPNRKTLAIYKLYRVVDSEDLQLAVAALDGYLKDVEKAGKLNRLAQSHTVFTQ